MISIPAMKELAVHAAEKPKALPTVCYRDEEFWNAECEKVLRPGWHAVARVHQLDKSGDYVSVTLFGEPILVVRGDDGVLRGFSRLCLHRAFPIVEGSGNARSFSCPYHRWGYALDGQLRAAPLMDQVDGFDAKGCRLPEVKVLEWMGFVLVSLDSRAEAPRLSGLEERLGREGFADYRIARTLSFDSPWNWKVMVENFIESYHHLGAHAGNFQQTNPAAGTYAIDVGDDGILLENPAVDGEDPFWVAQLFPTLLFALARGNLPLASWYEMDIQGPDRFTLHIHLMLPPELVGEEELIDAIVSQVQVFHAEDVAMCEGIQRGAAAKLFQPTRLAVQEETVAAFHRHLHRKML